LIIVHRAGHRDQTAYHLALTENGAPVQIDDTIFATASHGTILVSDRDGEKVYAITRNIFSSGAAYSATPTSVAALDADTGVLTDVVTGMVSPHGMAFVPAPDEE
jgi:glucose dehydrogenase